MSTEDNSQVMDIQAEGNVRSSMAGVNEDGIIRTSWNSIVATFKHYYFELHDTERIKLYFCNGQKVEGNRNNWALISLVDALAQQFEPFPRAGKVKFNSASTLAMSIQEVLSKHDLNDGSIIEVVNELSEWESYEALEGFVSRCAGRSSHFIFLIRVFKISTNKFSN